MYKSVCVSVYVFAYVHVEAQRMLSCPFLNGFLPSFWDRATHWTWCSQIQLDQLVSKADGSSCLCLCSVRVTWCWAWPLLGAEDPNSGPCACTANTACWAGSLAGLFQLSAHSYLIWGCLLFFYVFNILTSHHLKVKMFSTVFIFYLCKR